MRLIGVLLAAVAVGAAVTLPGSSPAPPSAPATPDPFADARRTMVETQIRARGIRDERVLRAMLTVPRHRFVEARYLAQAYNDHPLPIGYGQTISQPYIVALMSEQAAVRPGHRVLEIGTGSGYQAAILAELTDQVYTIEIIEPLARAAEQRLRDLGYRLVRTRIGDGYLGWPEAAPFDAILVTAAPDHVPPPLARQLKEGGRMVIPVGPPGLVQTLWRITKADGQLKFTNLGDVAFVPLVRR
ncbi:MAG: protein-L-isoaspartate(D-aspartate) O-methyltransferase [Armatimonadota bacterium]|nr:protein-L-isoaspartate(D-aspartate) O-methyltransferase [Armatimonadota bacterium]MDR7550769.1 protein-L-isoaspartate(D-aspartate) O-methyltransferase [Armatimonadota bacterium]